MSVFTAVLEVMWDATAHATDGDMEAAGTASYTATNCTLAKDATAYAGTQSLLGTNTLANGYASQSGSLAAAQVVTVSVRAKGGDAGTQLQIYSTPSNTQLATMTNPDTTNWNPLRVSGTIPAADTGYQVRMVNGSGAATACRWDALEIENWTDETSFRVSCAWKRGRDYASMLTGRSTAGTLTAVLDNPSGRYAPLNTASPLYGNLIPGRKVRVRATAPSAQILWQGFLDSIRPDPGGRGNGPTATLTAYGPLRWIADRTASTAVYISILTGTAIGAVLDDAGWPSSDRTLDAGQITMNRWKADGNSALSHLQEIEELEFGFIAESKDGKIVWEDGQHRLNAPHTVSQAVFSDASDASNPYSEIQEEDPWHEVFNEFRAEVTLFTVQASAVLWTLGEVPSINPSATLEYWAVYPTPDAPTQADHVDAWTTPVSATDYTANTAANGSGTDKTAQIGIAVSKFANSMKISVTNNDAGVVYLTFLQARGTAVYKGDPVRIVSTDSTSQTAFGRRTYPLPGKFYPSTTVAKTYTDAGLARYKDQLAIISLTYRADMDSAHLTQAISRDLSDRISLVAQNTLASGAQLGINTDMFIESEEHRLDLGGWWVKYALSDSRTVTGYWQLDVGQLDSTTKLAV